MNYEFSLLYTEHQIYMHMFFIWVLLTCWIVYDHMNYEFPNFFLGTILVTIISNFTGHNGGHQNCAKKRNQNMNSCCSFAMHDKLGNS